MSLTVGELVGYLTLDDSQWRRTTAQAKTSAKQMTDSVSQGASGAADSVGKMNRAAGLLKGTMATLGVAAGGAALVDFTRKSVDAASSLEEVESKAAVIFGTSLPQVKKFATETADDLNLSERAAYQYAASFGQLFDSVGMAQDQSADFSVTLAELAADMASFNDISVDEAFQKLRSGLAGEAEPLRTVGVFLSEAKVEAEAYASGLAVVGEELTDAEKIQARMNIIMRETKTAQGDVARTAESYANQQRGLSAEIEDFQATLGQELAPTLASTVGLLTDMLRATGALNDMLSGSGGLAGSIKTSLVEALGNVAPPVGYVVGQLEQLGTWLDYVSGDADEATRAIAGLDQEIYYSGRGIADIEPATRGLVGNLDGIDGSADAAADGIEDVGEAAGDAETDISDLADAIRDMGSLFSEADAAGDSLAAAFDDLVNGAGDLRRDYRHLNDALGESNGGMWAQNDAAREAREKLRGLAGEALETAAAQAELDGNTDRAARTTRKAREDFIQVATQMGLTRQEARTYADQLGLIPKKVRTGVDLYGTEGAIAKAARVQAALLGIKDRYVNVFVTEVRRDATAANRGTNPGGIQGPRASGGPVARGQAYMVGEQGPELFVPGAAGSVVPSHRSIDNSRRFDVHGNVILQTGSRNAWDVLDQLAVS